MDIFRFQAFHNPLYKEFIDRLHVDVDSVSSLTQIPFLPIRFFKTHSIKTGQWKEEGVFTSSGTTKSNLSHHYVADMSTYLDQTERCFEYFFGPLTNYHFLALLPSYLERTGSSLIAMIDHFIQKSGSSSSGFYLNDREALLKKAAELKQDSTRKVIVWGVSFALLDLAEIGKHDLSHCLIFETGGMKGRRREITRAELHQTLQNSFGVEAVFSEYGMTELFSQAYTNRDVRFQCPPWLKIIGRDPTDPMEKGQFGVTAGLNIIDIANFHSISFIETEDLGIVYKNGDFEVLGRMDNSDIRGCSLMV